MLLLRNKGLIDIPDADSHHNYIAS